MRALVSSAARIVIGDDGAAKAIKASRQQWQHDAWSYRDSLGEIRFAGRYVGNALSRIRLFAAVDPQNGQEPIPIEDAVLREGETPQDFTLRTGLSEPVEASLAEAARDELARIRSQQGGTAALLATYGENMFVAGECYLVAEDEREVTNDRGEVVETVPEQWDIRSTDELTLSGSGKWEVKTSPSGQGRELPDESLVVRFWNRHPRWGNLADSSMRGVLDDCDELVVLKKEIKGLSKSRLAGAGVLFIAQELSFGPDDPTEDGSSETDEQDPFVKDLTDAAAAAIKDEDSAAVAVPVVARVPAKFVKRGEGWEHWAPERPFDAQAIERRSELRTSISTGLDIPAEVLTGKAGLNHWSAWQVDEETYKAHVDPTTIGLCDGLTVAVLRPALIARGIKADTLSRVVVWRDPSALVVRPNRFADAQLAHDRFVISDAALRDAGGFSDADAPDDDELSRRVGVKKGIFDASITRAILEAFVLPEGTDLPEPTAPGEAPAGEEPAPVVEEDTGPPEQQASLVAAAPARVRALGKRLAAIDRSLRDRLHAAADAAVRSGVEVAGKRVKSRVASAGPNGRRGQAYEVVRDLPARRITSTLGAAMVAATGLTDDELLADSLAELERQFEEWVRDGQEATLDEIAATLDLSDADRDGMRSKYADARAAAWTRLEAALVETMTARLYDPDPEAPEVGEHTAGLLVPLGVVRVALAVAGGAGLGIASGGIGDDTRPLTEGEELPLGLALGPYAMDALRQGGIEPEGYTWTYGVSRRPFEPHRQLDGVEFSSFEDDVLANTYGWPDVSHFAPGDHAGCGCDMTPTFMLAGEATAPFTLGEPSDELAAAGAVA